MSAKQIMDEGVALPNRPYVDFQGGGVTATDGGGSAAAPKTIVTIPLPPVSSVFGRTGAVVAAEGDYSLDKLSDVNTSGQADGQFLQRASGVWVPTSLDTDGTMAANSDTKVPSQKAIRTYVGQKIADLVNSAPGTLDTLGEIATALAADESTASALATTVGTKIPKSLVDAKGDLLIGTADDTPDRLAVGTNDTVLAADSTQPTGHSWRKVKEVSMDTGTAGLAKGAFSVNRHAALALNNNQEIVFDTSEYDVSSWYNVATGRFTPQVAGIYRFSAVLHCSNVDNAGFGSIYLEKNSTTFKQGPTGRNNSGAAALVGFTVSGTFSLNGSTDYVSIWLFVTGWSANRSASVDNANNFCGELIGRP